MDFTAYLDHEWLPSLGCTEPAAVAYAAALAAEQATGEVLGVHLACDRRVYKNCHAAGIPRSGGRAGVDWALALGAELPDASAGLESFARLDERTLAAAEALVGGRRVTVEVDPEREALRIDCRVTRSGGTGRAVLAGNHTRVVRLERDGRALPGTGAEGSERDEELERWLAGLSLADCLALAETPTDADRARLREGCERNLAIARHGLGLLPASFVEASRAHRDQELACLVNAGVQARMSGAELTVMTLAGSGNKGITVSVPLATLAASRGDSDERRDASLALACLLTSLTTQRLGGAVSTMCGAAIAAGAGLAAGVVHLEGGGEQTISRAIDNVVGSVTGMICDGAKVGCGLKASTGVDAALRAAALATAGFGVPATNGVVGQDGTGSLANLGRLARHGMGPLETEVLGIMQEKLR